VGLKCSGAWEAVSSPTEVARASGPNEAATSRSLVPAEPRPRGTVRLAAIGQTRGGCEPAKVQWSVVPRGRLHGPSCRHGMAQRLVGPPRGVATASGRDQRLQAHLSACRASGPQARLHPCERFDPSLVDPQCRPIGTAMVPTAVDVVVQSVLKRGRSGVSLGINLGRRGITGELDRPTGRRAAGGERSTQRRPSGSERRSPSRPS
jgi:hypothetical protein